MMMIKDNHYVAIVADVAVAPEGLSRRGEQQDNYNTMEQTPKRLIWIRVIIFVAKPLELGLSFSALDSSIL